MIRDVKFPPGTKFGPAASTVGITVGGSAGDWIVNELGIPAVEPEIGSHDDLVDWMPKSAAIAFKIADDFFPMLKYASSKIGNEITIQPQGFQIEPNSSGKNISIFINVTNHGFSDQILLNWQIRFLNKNFKIIYVKNNFSGSL